MHFSNLQAYNICRVYFLLSNKLWTYFRSTYIFVHRFMDHSLFSKIASKFRIFFSVHKLYIMPILSYTVYDGLHAIRVEQEQQMLDGLQSLQRLLSGIL